MSKRRAVRKQGHQKVPERDVLQRPLEDRLAQLPDHGLELADVGARRNPAGLRVQLGHPRVVLVEERGDVLREVRLVLFRQVPE